MSKTAIICIGGGMRSAYSAGVLYGLGTKINIREVDLVVACSGSAGSALSYAIGTVDSLEQMKRIWTELLSTPKFISYTRFWRLLDIDYLIDTVFKKLAPTRYESLAGVKTEYRIAVVESRSGKLSFLGKDRNVDPYELLRATKALPFYYGKTVCIQGTEYIDGKVGQTTQSYVDHALLNGATKILLIDDSPSRTLHRRIIIFLYALTTPRLLRRKLLKDIMTTPTHTVPAGVQLEYLRRESLPAFIATRSKKKLQDTFNIGIQDIITLEGRVRELLGK